MNLIKAFWIITLYIPFELIFITIMYYSILIVHIICSWYMYVEIQTVDGLHTADMFCIDVN